jgi:hypothetical protein
MNNYLLKGTEFPYLLFLSSEVMVSEKETKNERFKLKLN